MWYFMCRKCRVRSIFVPLNWKQSICFGRMQITLISNMYWNIPRSCTTAIYLSPHMNVTWVQRLTRFKQNCMWFSGQYRIVHKSTAFVPPYTHTTHIPFHAMVRICRLKSQTVTFECVCVCVLRMPIAYTSQTMHMCIKALQAFESIISMKIRINRLRIFQ